MSKYYTKVRIESTYLYFDSFEKLQEFIELFWNGNVNHEYVQIAASDSIEYTLNTTKEV